MQSKAYNTYTKQGLQQSIAAQRTDTGMPDTTQTLEPCAVNTHTRTTTLHKHTLHTHGHKHIHMATHAFTMATHTHTHACTHTHTHTYTHTRAHVHTQTLTSVCVCVCMLEPLMLLFPRTRNFTHNPPVRRSSSPSSDISGYLV